MNSMISAGTAVLGFPIDYTILDIETTGLDPAYDSIIEISALRIREGKVVDSFSSLASRPGLRIPSFITSLTGITNAMLKDAPYIKDVLKDFLDFAGKDLIVGHNIAFDMRFIRAKSLDLLGCGFPNDSTDTMMLSRRICPEAAGHKLEDLSERYRISYTGAHRALTDCRITYSCLKAMEEEAARHFDDPLSFFLYMKRHGQVCKSKTVPTPGECPDPAHPFYKKTVTIVGDLKTLSRQEAYQRIADLGGKNMENISRNTAFCVVGDNDASCTCLKEERYEVRFDGCHFVLLSEKAFLSLAGFMKISPE